jgi:PAS domain-containing protein
MRLRQFLRNTIVLEVFSAMASDGEINTGEMKTTASWYAAALNSLGNGVIAADSEGKFTFLNPAAERLTVWAQAEAMGQDISAVYHVVNAETGESARQRKHRGQVENCGGTKYVSMSLTMGPVSQTPLNRISKDIFCGASPKRRGS